jgi:hypothetical protein
MLNTRRKNNCIYYKRWETSKLATRVGKKFKHNFFVIAYVLVWWVVISY